MSKERTVLLRTTSFSVEAGEAAVGARPATVASDDKRESSDCASGCRLSREAALRAGVLRMEGSSA